MKDDLTFDQARDLARYLLGPDVHPMNSGLKSVALFRGSTLLGAGHNWRAAFRSAGAKWPARPAYISKGRTVMLGPDAKAEACSNTFAARIAAALNEYDVKAGI